MKPPFTDGKDTDGFIIVIYDAYVPSVAEAPTKQMTAATRKMWI